MSRMFSSTARVWARMSSTVRPLASRCAPAMESSARRALVPDTKMKSPARRKCGKVPRGLALPATTALSARAAARPASSALMRAIPPPARLELNGDVHGVGEEAERVRPALAADARELHPAEGRAQVAQIPVIDPGDAHFQLAGYAMGALQIRGPHGSRQPIAGVVRQLHRLLFGIERRHVADGTEDLLLDAARSFTESAALLMMAAPVADSPVKAMAFTSGWRTSASPVEPAPKPCTRLKTPGGTPASCITSASSAAEEGVSSEGLATTALPHASAGATFQVMSRNGRFHGAMIATTPTGLCTE